jgi:hypothetical protein
MEVAVQAAPETTLPAHVRVQGEAADALHRKMYPEQYPNADGPQTGKEVVAGAAKPEEGKETPTARQPETVKTGEEGKVAAPGPDEWKQKYDTLQGKYNAEVPQLHAAVAGLRNQLHDTLAKVETLEAEKAQAAAGKEAGEKKDPGEEEITDPKLKAFSEEYPDIFDAVKKMVTPKAPETAKAPDPNKGPAPEAKGTDGRQTMLYYLNRDMPTWRDVNRDPAFIRSLQETDPLTGMSKMEALNLAYSANDFTTVLGFFRDFRPADPGADPGKKENLETGRELTAEEKALAPPKGNRAPAPLNEGAQGTVTPKDLENFYIQARKQLWGPIDGQKYRTEEARLLAALMKNKN